MLMCGCRERGVVVFLHRTGARFEGYYEKQKAMYCTFIGFSPVSASFRRTIEDGEGK